MEKLLRGLFLIPIVVGIMQWVKQIISNKLLKFMRIFTCIISICVAYGYVAAMEITTMNNAMIIFWGVIIWLSASGLYEASKNTINAFRVW